LKLAQLAQIVVQGSTRGKEYPEHSRRISLTIAEKIEVAG
jgi:hypothetical protein